MAFQSWNFQNLLETSRSSFVACMRLNITTPRITSTRGEGITNTSIDVASFVTDKDKLLMNIFAHKESASRG